jgi:hypothetical protein
VNVTSPRGGDHIDGLVFPISVEVTNYLLREPGGCGGKKQCGLLRVQLDGDNCNTGTAPYNVLLTSSSGSPAQSTAAGVVNAGACRTSIVRGSTKLRVELLTDSYAALTPEVSHQVELRF